MDDTSASVPADEASQSSSLQARAPRMPAAHHLHVLRASKDQLRNLCSPCAHAASDSNDRCQRWLRSPPNNPGTGDTTERTRATRPRAMDPRVPCRRVCARQRTNHGIAADGGKTTCAASSNQCGSSAHASDRKIMRVEACGTRLVQAIVRARNQALMYEHSVHGRKLGFQRGPRSLNDLFLFRNAVRVPETGG